MLVDEQDTNLLDQDPAPASSILASYPHVAVCPRCLGYAKGYLETEDAWSVLAATLSYHDSCHRSDLLEVIRNF